MAMIFYKKNNSTSRRQGGMTLLELLIAMVVLAVGVIGSMALVLRAIGGDAASKQTSNATVLAQMVTERIMAVPASNPVLATITDCVNTVSNVSTSPGGPAVTASGSIDLTQAKIVNYSLLYTDCDTLGRQAVYDVRWNITQISPYANMLTVSAQLQSAGTNRTLFAPVTTIRTIVGQGT